MRLEDRVCFYCTDNIEDEQHVLLKCPIYADIRNVYFNYAISVDKNFINLSDDDKIVFMFTNNEMLFYTARICHDILFHRKCILHS